MPENAFARARLESTGIDYQIRAITDAAMAIVPVASEARHVSYDCITGACEPVEQRGFADIGTATSTMVGFMAD